VRRDYAYYPGCSLRGTGAEFADSLEAVFGHLCYTLEELPDWNCCGATSGHATAPRATLALGMRNLAQAAEIGKPVVVPCAACYHNLRAARMAAAEGDAELVAAALPMPAQRLAAVEIVHPIEVLTSAEALAEVRAKVVEKLAGLRVASYYGCLLSRPPAAVRFDDTENPVRMDKLVAALGAEPVDWSWKVDCCGGNLALGAGNVAVDLVSRILKGAEEAGANAIAVACPLCHANLDMRQFEVSRKLRRKVEVPIFYFTELMAMAYDLPQAEKWLRKHITTPFPLVDALFGEDE
jgi:heterodisulfide reductase subunit B